MTLCSAPASATGRVFGVSAEISTVAGALDVVASLTVRDKTYVPGWSAVNVAEASDGSERFAELPDGID
jgi:hypothetical protein